MVTAILFVWSLPLIFMVECVVIPYIADRLNERRWRRMHPDMPSWRRVRS